MPLLKHFDNLGTARFITFSCYRRLQLLTDNQVRKIFINHLKFLCEKYQIGILGYVLMPEHVHLVLYPQSDLPIGRIIGEIKSKSAREILNLIRKRNNSILNKLRTGDKMRFWQKRCYDHNCRTPKTVIEKIIYCHKNPVTRGLVNSPKDWIWSSYRWYMGLDKVIMNIDGVEL